MSNKQHSRDANDFANRWHNPSFVKAWHKAAQESLRDRQGQEFLVSLLPFERDESFRALEILSGFGRLSRRLLDAYPGANVVCVDYSEPMMKLAQKNLKEHITRVTFVCSNLDHAAWVRTVAEKTGGDFDVIVSSTAIHDLQRNGQRRIYQDVFKLLKPQGSFFDYDFAWYDSIEANRFVQHIADRQRASPPSSPELRKMSGYIRRKRPEPWKTMLTLTQRLEAMERAGFAGVSCYWRYLQMAVYGGFKAS